MCVKRWDSRWGLKKQRRLLLRVSPGLCLLAANLISEGKYMLCLYNAGLCLCSASEPSTILEIVSSLLKRFQTVTVEPVSFHLMFWHPSPSLVCCGHLQRIEAFWEKFIYRWCLSFCFLLDFLPISLPDGPWLWLTVKIIVLLPHTFAALLSLFWLSFSLQQKWIRLFVPMATYKCH